MLMASLMLEFCTQYPHLNVVAGLLHTAGELCCS